MKHIFCSIIFIFVLSKSIAQSIPCKIPEWYFSQEKETKDYVIIKRSGSGETQKIAVKNAEVSLMSSIASLKGCEIKNSDSYYFQGLEVKGNNAMEIGSHGISIFTSCGDLKDVRWRIDNSYTCLESNGLIEHYVKVKVKLINLKKAALFSIIPGGGHYYKREPIIGTISLASTLSTLGLTCFSKAKSNYYNDKFNLTRETDERIDYEDSKNKWQRKSINWGVTTGVLYIASIIHASLNKKRNRLYSSASFLSNIELKPFYGDNLSGLTISYYIK